MMDIKTMENSTVLLKYNDCVYKVEFHYPIKRNRLKKERYSENFASSQICFILNELFTKVEANKPVRKIQTEYFNVNIRIQEWLLGPKMQMKSGKNVFNCYPKFFLLEVELKDFLIKAEKVDQPTPVSCNNFKMPQIKSKTCDKTIVGNKDKEKADMIFAKHNSRHCSPQVSKVPTMRTLILATPKNISEDNIKSKSLKKRSNISEILHKHDSFVESFGTIAEATPRRQCELLSIDQLFKDGNKKFSDSEQKLSTGSRHCKEKLNPREKAHLKLAEIYKPFTHTKSSNSHAVNGSPVQHNIIKQFPASRNSYNNRASQKMRKDFQTAESGKKSSRCNIVSEIDLRPKVCASSSQNEKRKEFDKNNEYLITKKRKIHEVNDNLSEHYNSQECKTKEKHAVKKQYRTVFSNSSESCSSVKPSSYSYSHKINGNEMEKAQHIPFSVQSEKQHFSHRKHVRELSKLENVTIRNELINKKLQQGLSIPDQYFESRQKQLCYHKSKVPCPKKPEATYVRSYHSPSEDVLHQSSNFTDINEELYDSNNSCLEIEDSLPDQLYKDDVCLFRSPGVKLVKIAKKKKFDFISF